MLLFLVTCWLEQAIECCGAKFQNHSDIVHTNVLLCHVEPPWAWWHSRLSPSQGLIQGSTQHPSSTVQSERPDLLNQGRGREGGTTQASNSEAYVAPDNFW